MKKTIISLIILILVVSWSVNAQQFKCGITDEDTEIIFNRFEKIRAYLKENPLSGQKSNEAIYVPITFHLVANTDGSGRVSEKNILSALCNLNEIYLPTGIQFFIKNPNFSYINNSTVYNSPWETSNLLDLVRDNSSINVFVVNKAGIPDENGGLTRAYFTPFNDWVVADIGSLGSKITLAHELGHFFSLGHPYTGWDNSAYDPAKDGIPAPPTDRNGKPTELMDRSNCEISGDRLCDTPPDYFDGRTESCDYIGGARDPNNILITPDKSNVLSNFLGCDEFSFTPSQLEIIIANFNSDISFEVNTRSRKYLRNNSNNIVPPNFTPSSQLVLPSNQSTISNSSPIMLNWTASEGATHYLLELSLVPSFSVGRQQFIVNQASFELDGNLVSLGRTYYWRVYPFNAFNTCSSPTQTYRFTIGETTALEDIAAIESFNILPNPAPANQQFQLLAEVSESFEAQAALFNTSGQMVKSLGQYNFIQGTNTFDIPTDNLSPGIYMLSLQNDKGRSIRRIVVY